MRGAALRDAQPVGRRLRRLLAAAGFEALATTSAGFAWSLGKLDEAGDARRAGRARRGSRGRDDLPLNVDSERCYPDDPGGVAETVALLADAGAAGFSIEDYDPATGRDRRRRGRGGAGRRRGRGGARPGPDGAHRPGGEPHPRRRRPRRHDRPAASPTATPAPTRLRTRPPRPRPDRGASSRRSACP